MPIKAQRGGGGIAPTFRNLRASKGCVVNATPLTLYRRQRPGIYCTGGWVGLGVGLDVCGKSLHHQDSIPGLSNRQRVAILTTQNYYISLYIIYEYNILHNT